MKNTVFWIMTRMHVCIDRTSQAVNKFCPNFVKVKAKFLPMPLKQIALAKYTAYPSLSNEGLRSQTQGWQPAKPQDAKSLPSSIFGTPGSLNIPRGLQ